MIFLKRNESGELFSERKPELNRQLFWELSYREPYGQVIGEDKKLLDNEIYDWCKTNILPLYPNADKLITFDDFLQSADDVKQSHRGDFYQLVAGPCGQWIFFINIVGAGGERVYATEGL